VVEAMLARTGYRGVGIALGERGWLPGLQEGFRLIRRDEGRHVAFGIQFIADAVARDSAAAAIVEATFERHLPNVLATVAGFDFPHPLVDIALLQDYALGAHRQFMAAAGVADDAEAGELEAELTGA
jgi:ribonucleoside-diphosphate reductase beta chain